MSAAMQDHMLRQSEVRARDRKRLWIVWALVAAAFVTHLAAFFGGGFLAIKFLGPPEPIVLVRKDVREVQVIRCDKAALQQCARKKL